MVFWLGLLIVSALAFFKSGYFLVRNLFLVRIWKLKNYFASLHPLLKSKHKSNENALTHI